MLGMVGFGIAAATFVLYACSALKLKDKKTTFAVSAYASAFVLTAIACAIWALGTQAPAGSLETYVLAGDAFLLTASLVLFSVLVAGKPLYLALASLGAVGAFAYRVGVDYASPLMRDGVLVFYTPRVFGAMLALVVLTVWLKVNMKFYEEFVANRLKLDVLRQVYFSCNVLSIIGLTGVMFARKSLTISVAFSMIVLGYVTIGLLNFAVSGEGKKGAPRGK